MKHAKFFKYSLLTALLLGAVQSLSAQEATPTGPRKAARYSALLKAKNLVVTTNGQTPKKFYYLVSANDILKLRMLKENDADYITFGMAKWSFSTAGALAKACSSVKPCTGTSSRRMVAPFSTAVIGSTFERSKAFNASRWSSILSK